MSENKNRRRERPQKSRGFFTKLLIMVALVIAVFFGLTVFFRVNTFEIQGVENYSEDAVKSASGIEEGSSLLTINKGEVAGRIITRLPYVNQVEIRKQLPGTVVIAVRECQPVAAVQSEYGDFWLINEDGKLLEQVSEERTASTVRINGISALLPEAGDQILLSKEDQAKLDTALSLYRMAKSYGLIDGIREINVTELFDIRMYYSDRFEIELGSTDELDYKIKYLSYAMESLTEQSGLIDLTFDQDRVARFLPW